MNAFSIDTSGESTVLRLDGEVTIEHAAILHRELAEKSATGKSIIVDAAKLTRLDAAILQVLIMSDPGIFQRSTLGFSKAWNDSLRRFGVDGSVTSA